MTLCSNARRWRHSCEGGTPADLRDNVKVEAEGVWTAIGGDLLLVAETIEFE